MIAIIACVQGDMGIGYKGDLIWKLPEDQKAFRRLTKGHTIVMGRKTWESLPAPLSDRRNIVLSRHAIEGAGCVSDPDIVREIAENEPVYIIGGAGVYKEFLPDAEYMFLTRVLSVKPADTFFPEIDWVNWDKAYDEPLCTKPVSAFLEVWHRNGL